MNKVNLGNIGGPNSDKNGTKLSSRIESKEKRRQVLRRIVGYMMHYKLLVLAAFVLMMLSNLLALIGPKLSGLAVNEIDVEGQIDLDKIISICTIMVICYIVSGLLSYLLSFVMVNLSQKIIYTMRKQVFEHLTTLPVGYFDTHATGDIISHISYDIDTVNASLSHDLIQICASVITVVGSLIMMITISPALIVVFLFTVPASILFTRYKTKKIRPFFRLRSIKLGELNGYAEEMLSGHRTITVYGREKVISDRFDVKNDEAGRARYEADWHGAIIGPSVNYINNISIALVTTLGAIFYMLTLTVAGFPAILCINIGDVQSFVLYSRKFSGPINEFANIFNDIQSAMAAAERVFTLIDEEPEKADSENASDVTDIGGEVSIDHVKFGYVPGKTIIHDMSLEVKKGQVVAIVGPTGAGKTTVVNLLMRFYDPDSGDIKIDGESIYSMTRKSLRSAYSMVLQDTWLFCGSIYDNITYGREDATPEQVYAAAKAAKIDGYIRSLPDGYDTVLSDDGVNISKGQKQLITIARAMLPKAPMLILDEATSNVDSRTEMKIQEAMYKLMENKTCFVIAHRLSTIQNADLILVVKNGDIIEQGNHETLMKAGGFYSTLYNSQFA